MPSPPFYLQIVDANGVVIKTRAGGKHEAALIDCIVKKILPLGIGIFKTSTQVEKAIRDGMAAAIHDLKIQNPFDVMNG